MLSGASLNVNVGTIPENCTTDDNCPLRHSPADCYIGRMSRFSKATPSLPRRREPRIPGPTARADDRKWNGMQPNATELKVSPLLATPEEANQDRNQGQLAHRLRVSGGPNEATLASFPASPPGVNRAKQGQMGPGINPPSGPFSLEGRRLG